MADTVGTTGGGRDKIGRQIVLPLSKAFEIAWKGMKIRIWRSLITMSGIVLAIAFLMSVWTAGVFHRALGDVGEEHELYSVVEGALEAEAIASGGVRIPCAVVEQTEGWSVGQITPGTSIRDFLDAEEAFQAERVPADVEAILELLSAEAEGRPDALVLAGLPAVFSDPEVAAAVEQFVTEGGFLLVYGAAGAQGREHFPLQDVLPALPGDGTFTVAGADITRGQQSVEVQWRGHPPAEFLKTSGKPQAVALASAAGQTVVWSWDLGEGSVAWYPVAEGAAGDLDVISWFVRGRAVEAGEIRERVTGSLMARLVVRGARRKGEVRDMRGVWLVTLSLMVCVVGITNAMLMSVTERFREIGTMKCLGALDKFVVRLFLIESSLQGVVGSVAGAFIGFLLAFVRALFTFHVKEVETGEAYWLVLHFFPAGNLLGRVGVALVTGILLSVVAAIYPAIRAARMQPVQAMRSEA